MAIVTWFYNLFCMTILTALMENTSGLRVLDTITLIFNMQLKKLTGMHKYFDTNEALERFLRI